MKIAIVNPSFTGPAGGERQALRLAVELQDKGHEVEVFTNELDREKCYPDLISRVKVSLVPYPFRTRFVAYKMLLGMRAIGKQVSALGFDVVNVHNFPSEWAAYFIKGAPVVWMCNEPPFWYFLPEDRARLRFYNRPVNIWFDKKAVKKVSDIVVLSNLMGDVVKKTYGKDFRVVRSGIEIGQFEGLSGDGFRKKHGLEDCFLLLQVGYISHYKRNDDSIRALRVLARTHDNVRLVFVGNGVPECVDRLKRMAAKYGLSDKVIFLGSLPDEELRDAYVACDIFLFPAFQSWSLVAIEAMASGKPVIISKKCGAAEIIENGVNGFTMEHERYEEMAGHVETLMSDETLRRQIGNNAKAYVREHMSWQVYASEMERIMSDAASAWRR